MAYAIDLPKKSHLRKQLDFNSQKEKARYTCTLLATMYCNSILKLRLSSEQSLKKIKREMIKSNAKDLGVEIIKNDQEVWIYYEAGTEGNNIYILADSDGHFTQKTKDDLLNAVYKEIKKAVKENKKVGFLNKKGAKNALKTMSHVRKKKHKNWTRLQKIVMQAREKNLLLIFSDSSATNDSEYDLTLIEAMIDNFPKEISNKSSRPILYDIATIETAKDKKSKGEANIVDPNGGIRIVSDMYKKEGLLESEFTSIHEIAHKLTTNTADSALGRKMIIPKEDLLDVLEIVINRLRINGRDYIIDEAMEEMKMLRNASEEEWLDWLRAPLKTMDFKHICLEAITYAMEGKKEDEPVVAVYGLNGAIQDVRDVLKRNLFRVEEKPIDADNKVYKGKIFRSTYFYKEIRIGKWQDYYIQQIGNKWVEVEKDNGMWRKVTPGEVKDIEDIAKVFEEIEVKSDKNFIVVGEDDELTANIKSNFLFNRLKSQLSHGFNL